MTRTGTFSAGLVVVLLAAASGFLLLEPWHGPVLLALSESHGVDAGDLPAVALIALAVAIGYARLQDVRAQPWSLMRLARAPSAVVLGALLLLAGIDTGSDPPLVPAGGGTFHGSTQHVDGRRADPLGRWSHLATTYDGAELRLYVDGSLVSSSPMTGTIRTTTDPLWIGGNRPYGEYFQGVIDEVRVYDRALGPSEVQAEMSTPLSGGRATPAAGLVAAYPFDAGSGTAAADASGNGNGGTIRGARWTRRGRFGHALRFDGAGDMVRVPPSASLDLSDAMTLSGWIRPPESQTGWRTILHRQTDAYFLMAGGGHRPVDRAGALDDTRVAIEVIAALALFMALAGSRPPFARVEGLRYWPAVVLCLAGFVVDAALAPADALIGPILLTMWCAVTAAHRTQAAGMFVLATAFTTVTIVSVAGLSDVELLHHDGGIARSAALGTLLLTATLLNARHGSAVRDTLRPAPTR